MLAILRTSHTYTFLHSDSDYSKFYDSVIRGHGTLRVRLKGSMCGDSSVYPSSRTRQSQQLLRFLGVWKDRHYRIECLAGCRYDLVESAQYPTPLSHRQEGQLESQQRPRDPLNNTDFYHLRLCAI